MVNYYDKCMQENPEAFQEGLQIERERFSNILTDLLDAVEYEPPARTLTIADVACGRCVEAPVLVDVFGKRGGDREVNIVGMDIVPERIETARKQVAGLPGNHSFAVADACKNSAYGNHEFDVALFRRQNVFNDPLVWRDIFATAMDRLGRNGIAIVTSLSGSEHIWALRTFNRVRHEYVPALEIPLATRYLAESQASAQPSGLLPIESCASVFYPVHPS